MEIDRGKSFYSICVELRGGDNMIFYIFVGL